MNPSKPLALVYWGKKGGGNRFTLNAAIELSASGIPIILSLSSSNENLSVYKEMFENNCLIADFDMSPKSFFLEYFRRREIIRNLMDHLEEKNVQNIICMMPHPFDLPLFKLSHKKGIHVSRIIHDFKRHPGDYWPNGFSILFRALKSSEVLFLSEFVKKRTLASEGKKFLISFPDEHLFLNSQIVHSEFDTDVLIIGRFRKYKGLSQLENIVQHMNKSSRVKFKLSGSGKIKILPIANLEVHSEWMNEAEFESNIQKTQVVLLTHVEASQSGIPPLAQKLGKWVVLPRIAGLPEQVIDGVSGFVYEPDNLNSMAEALELAIKKSSAGEHPQIARKTNFTEDIVRIFQKDNRI